MSRRFAAADLSRRTNSRYRLPISDGLVFYPMSSLPGFTFTRASSATDGAPETGLPVTGINTYGVDILRDVSGKMGAPGWAVLEGPSTNVFVSSDDVSNAASWPLTIATSVTVTGGQTDPMGGTGGARIECAGAGDYVSQAMSGITSGPRCFSQYIQQGPGSGVYQMMNTFAGSGSLAEIAKGGTAGVSWFRDRLRSNAVTGTGTARLNDGTSWFSSGGLTAGARDAVMSLPQAEKFPFATSFIPTTATSETRAADDMRFTPPPDWYDGSKVIIIEWIPSYSSTEMNYSPSILESSNPFLIYFNGSTYFRILNGSTGSPNTSWRVGWSGGLVTEGGLPGFNAGDVLRFEFHVNRGLVLQFTNGVFGRQRNAPLDATDLIPGAGGWRLGGPWSGSTSTCYGLMRIGTAPTPADDPITWDDPGTNSTFVRASDASDGAPELGLPVDNVSFYTTDVLRDVSAKVGEPGWVLLEGARTNLNFTTGVRKPGVVGGTIIDEFALVPDGTNTGREAELSAATNRTTNVASITLPTVSGISVWSAWIKATQLAVDGDISLDLVNQDNTVTTTPITISLTAWQRFAAYEADNGSGVANPQLRMRNGDTDVRRWVHTFAQLEDQVSFQSSFIDCAPGVSTTRAADDLTKAAGEFDPFDTGVVVIQWRPSRNSTDVADEPNNWLFRTSAGRGVYVSGTTNRIGIATTSTTYVTSYDLVFSKGDLVEITVDINNSTLTSKVNGVVSKAQRLIAGSLAFTGLATYFGQAGAGVQPCFGLIRIGRKPLPANNPL